MVLQKSTAKWVFDVERDGISFWQIFWAIIDILSHNKKNHRKTEICNKLGKIGARDLQKSLKTDRLLFYERWIFAREENLEQKSNHSVFLYI